MSKLKIIVQENLYDFLLWVSYEIDESKLKAEYQKEEERKNKSR